MVRRRASGCVLQVQVPAGSMCCKRQLLCSILVCGVKEELFQIPSSIASLTSCEAPYE